MANTSKSINTAINYDTSCHRVCAKPASGATKTGVFRWCDFQDATLGSRFKTALEKLERLCYSVYGSRPASFFPVFKNWWHKKNPRCLWQPEQWVEYQYDMGTDCDSFFYQYYEYGAAGSSGYVVNLPNVPIRSVSGDWKAQMLDTSFSHDTVAFPFGSVTRFDGTQPDYTGKQTYDPKGTGRFGGDPAAVGTDGPVVIEGEDVEITWTPPGGISVTSAKLYYSVNGGAFSSIDMSGSPFSATITKKLHDTDIEWYIKAVYTNGGAPITSYEPGNAGAPAAGYTFTFFSHWNPYPQGLPELWDKCKKGTDEYTFAHDEQIQPGLINIARFICDYIGEQTHHNPMTRNARNACCYRAPITFYWSGSNKCHLYVPGGKDGIHPLHNFDLVDYVNYTSPRHSWRGTARDIGCPNPYFGVPKSWFSPPQIVELDECSMIDDTQCKRYWTGSTAGLQPEDVIDSVHIEELIAAIDYLVDNKIWITAAVKTRLKTPSPTACIPSLYGAPNFGCWGDYVDGVFIPLTKPPDWETCWDDDNTDYPSGICLEKLIYSGSKVSVVTDPCNDPGPDGSDYSIQYSTCDTNSLDALNQFYCNREIGSEECPDGPFMQTYLYYTVDSQGYRVKMHTYVCGPERNPGGCDDLHGNYCSEIPNKQRHTANDSRISRADYCSAGNKLEYGYACGTTQDGYGNQLSGIIPLESVTTVILEPPELPHVGCGSASNVDYTCYSANILSEYPDVTYECLAYGEEEDEEDELCVGYRITAVNGTIVCEFSCPHYYGYSGVLSNVTCYVKPTACYVSLYTNPQVWASIDLNLDDNGMPTLYDYAPKPYVSFARILKDLTEEEATDSEVWAAMTLLDWKILALCPCKTDTGVLSCDTIWYEWTQEQVNQT